MDSRQGNWLAKFQRNDQSQNGEDGILEKIFEILNISKGWCVELGAWDGKKYSNTYHLIQNHGWSGVLIEGDPHRFSDLKRTYASNSSVHCVQQFVNFDSMTCLEAILKKTPLPKTFDLLSIDIDGNDLHLWESVSHYQPKVVVIEYNPTIPNHVAFRQPRDMKIHQGNSLLALIQLGKEKEYQLIGTTETNAIFVQAPFYPLFGIQDNHIDLMRSKSPSETTLFQLYDGTLVLHGNQKLLWSGVPIKEKKLQVFPSFLRFFSTTNVFKKTLRQLWRLLYTRNVI